jgi:hypothetical protein
MSKKKNTLKDLDAFLKQQAATLVGPTPLSEQVEEPEQEETPAPTPSTAPIPVYEVTLNKILNDLETLSRKEGPSFRKKFYDLILQSAETNLQSLPEDKMLINTVLYLKNGSKWKEAIREYWRNKE